MIDRTPTLHTTYPFGGEGNGLTTTMEPMGDEHMLRINGGAAGSLTLDSLDQFDAIAAEVEKYRRMVAALAEPAKKAA